MPSIINLSPIWEHTLTEILNHGNKAEMGITMRSWVKHNNLEDMSDLLIYDLNDFTPGGTLCRYKETAETEETKLMPNTPLRSSTTFIGIFNTSFLSLNSIMMMMSLMILLLRVIGYCRQEENT